MSDEAVDEGWVDQALREEFPDLRLRSVAVDGIVKPLGRSPDGLRRRLKELSGRWSGAQAIALRSAPIPQAYRVFYREIGLDPETTRVPAEQAALDRLMHGDFRPRSLVDDAVLLAIVETGVPVWTLGADGLDGPLGLRPVEAGERLGEGEYAHDLPAGRLVVADAAGAVCELFGRYAPDHAVTKTTASMRLFTVQVAGVPEIHVSEALWLCAEALVER